MRNLRMLIAVLIVGFATMAVAGPAGAAPAAPPFALWAPWASGVTNVVGGPGYFWGQGDHTGPDNYAVDINGLRGGNTDCGQEVRGTAYGVVQFAGASGNGYGNEVVIDHGSGYTSRYAHLQDWTVSVGQVVPHGTVIGHIGSTGNTGGACHLHFVVYLNGTSVPNSPLSGVGLFDGVHVKSNNDVPTLRTADLNTDGRVNIVDLSIMAAHWGQRFVGMRGGDVNLDGIVNITDLSILASHWG